MSTKFVLILCAQVFLVQYAFGQWMEPAVDCRSTTPYGLNDGFGLNAAWPARGVGLGCGGLDYTATSGGGLIVTSGSALPPVGISLASENVFEGRLAAAGELPFVGTICVDGVMPTVGAGAVNYGCGSGATAMQSVADILAPGIAAPAFGGYGLGAIAAPGIGGFGPAPIAAPGIGGFGPAPIAAPGLGFRPDWAGCGCGYGV